ncbi:hypothetical protein GUJ93_ZPchr0006g44939 [Zizania palustris]|uniref:Uncharacterized protein n=1 Tax=Zizania palustris TaxID=103762 RepID=A0A8J5W1D5_ZIZPA|nr:hypothetical protein GUJ93_ZPchr0006g44939 [Zizania palustris]
MDRRGGGGNRNRTDLLAAGRQKLQQFRKKKEKRGPGKKAEAKADADTEEGSSKSGAEAEEAVPEPKSPVGLKLLAGDSGGSCTPFEEARRLQVEQCNGHEPGTAESSTVDNAKVLPVQKGGDDCNAQDVGISDQVSLEHESLLLGDGKSPTIGATSADGCQNLVEGAQPWELDVGEHQQVEMDHINRPTSSDFNEITEATVHSKDIGADNTTKAEVAGEMEIDISGRASGGNTQQGFEPIVSSEIGDVAEPGYEGELNVGASHEASNSIAREDTYKEADVLGKEALQENPGTNATEVVVAVDDLNLQAKSIGAVGIPLHEKINQVLLVSDVSQDIVPSHFEDIRKHLYLTTLSRDFIQLQMDVSAELNSHVTQQYSDEIINLQVVLEETEKSKLAVCEELQQCRNEFSNMNNMNEELELTVASLKEGINTSNNKCNHLEFELHASKENSQQILKELAGCRAMLEAVQKENLDLNANLAFEKEARKEVEEQRDHLSDENKNILSNLSDLEHSLASLKEEFNDGSNRYANLECELHSSKENMEHTLVELASCRALLETLQKDNLELYSNSSYEKEANKKLEEDLHLSYAKHQQLESHTRDMEAYFGQLTEQLIEENLYTSTSLDIYQTVIKELNAKRNVMLGQVQSPQQENELCLDSSEIIVGNTERETTIPEFIGHDSSLHLVTGNDSCNSTALQSLKGHLKVARVDLHDLQKLIERVSSRSDGRVLVSKLIQSFESKGNQEDLELSEREHDNLQKLTQEMILRLAEKLKVMTSDLAKTEEYVAELCKNIELSAKSVVQHESEREQTAVLVTKMDRFAGKLSNYKDTIDQLLSQVASVHQDADNHAGRLIDQAELLQNDVTERISILEKERMSLTNVLIEVNNKLGALGDIVLPNDLGGTECPGSLALNSVDCAAKLVRSLQEKLEDAQSDNLKLTASLVELKNVHSDVHKKSEHACEIVKKMYSSLQELLCNSLGRIDQLGTLNIQLETEVPVLRDGLAKLDGAVKTSRAELHKKDFELEQLEQKLSSVKEKLSIAVAKGKGLIVQRDSLKQTLLEKCGELEKLLHELQSKDALLMELESKIKSYADADRIEALESELSYIRNSATALRDSFLQKDSILQRIEEVLEDLDLPEHFHSRDIVEKIELVSKMAINASSITVPDGDKRSSMDGNSESCLVIDSINDEQNSNSYSVSDELKNKYDELHRRFYELAEHNNMLEQSLVERNNLIQKWEEVLGQISIPQQFRMLEPEDRIAWLGNKLLEVEHERDALQLKIEHLEDSSEMLISDLEESHKRISELSAEIVAIKAEKEFFSQSLEKLRFEFLGLSEKAVQDEFVRDNLRKDLAELQEKLAEKAEESKHYLDMEMEINKLLDLVRNALQDDSTTEFPSGAGASVLCLGGLLSKLLYDYRTLLSGSTVGSPAEKETHLEEIKLSNDTSAPETGMEDKEMALNTLSNELEHAHNSLALVEQQRDEAVEKTQSLMLELETLRAELNQLQGYGAEQMNSKDVDVISYMKSFVKSCDKWMDKTSMVDIPIMSNHLLSDSISNEKPHIPNVQLEITMDNADETQILYHFAIACHAVADCLKDCNDLKRMIHEHGFSVDQKAAELFDVMSNLQNKFTSQNNELRSFRDNIVELQSEIKQRDEEILSMHRNMSLLYEACTSSVAEIEGMTGIESGNQSCSIVQKHLSADDHIKSVVNQLVAAIKITQNSNEGSTNELKANVLELQQELQEKHIQISTISAELASHVREAECSAKQLSVELENSRMEVHNLQKHAETLLNQKNTLETQVSELKDMEGVAHEQHGRIKELSDELSRKDQEIESLMQALDEEEKELEVLENKSNDLEQILQEKEITLKSLEVSRTKALAKLATTVDKFDELHSLSESLLAEVENLQSQLQERDSEISFMRQEVTRSTNELLTTEESSKKYSSLINDFIKWLETALLQFGVHCGSTNDYDSTRVPVYMDMLDKKIGSLISESDDLRVTVQSKDSLLQIERTKMEELMRRSEALESSLSQKDSQIGLLRRDRTSGQPSRFINLPGTSEIEQVNDKVSPAAVVTQIRGARKVNTDQVAIDVEVQKDKPLDDEDDDKAHGFKSLTMSHIVPKFTRPISDRIDGMWVSADRLLMRQPTLRLGIICKAVVISFCELLYSTANHRLGDFFISSTCNDHASAGR